MSIFGRRPLFPPRDSVRINAPASLLLCYATSAVALLGSWLFWPRARQWWDLTDRNAFLALNGSMTPESPWHFIWTLANSRWFDLVPAGLILGLFAIYLFENNGRHFRPRFKLGLSMAVFALLWQRFVVKELLEQARLSPSLVVPDTVPIEGIYQWIPAVKGTAEFSFPGDHAGILLLTSLIMLHTVGWRKGLIALIVATLFSLPRLFGGAHWLTDVIVGGGFAGLMGAALFLFAAKFWQSKFRHD